MASSAGSRDELWEFASNAEAGLAPQVVQGEFFLSPVRPDFAT